MVAYEILYLLYNMVVIYWVAHAFFSLIDGLANNVTKTLAAAVTQKK